jgi:hypothetical protein
VTLDIDDTVDVVHGHQRLSLFNAHYDERCFLPIHIYDAATSRPVAVLLRPGKTPSGTEMVRSIRHHWPQTRITIRGDGHDSITAARRSWSGTRRMASTSSLAYPANPVLDRMVDETVDDIRTRRALDQKPCLRGFAETRLPGQILDDRSPCLCPDRGQARHLLLPSLLSASGQRRVQCEHHAAAVAANHCGAIEISGPVYDQAGLRIGAIGAIWV